MTLAKYFHPFNVLVYTICLALYLQTTSTFAMSQIHFTTWQNEEYFKTEEFFLYEMNRRLPTWIANIKNDIFTKKYNQYEVGKDSLFFYTNDGAPILSQEKQLQFLKQTVANPSTQHVVYVDCIIKPTQENIDIAGRKGHGAIAKLLKEIIDQCNDRSNAIESSQKNIEKNQAKITEITDKEAVYADKNKVDNLIKCYTNFIGQVFSYGVNNIVGEFQDYKELLHDPSNFTKNLRPTRLKVREKYKNEKIKPQLMKAIVQNELKKIIDKQQELSKFEENIKGFERLVNSLKEEKNNVIHEKRKKLIQVQAEYHIQNKTNTFSNQPNNLPIPVRRRDTLDLNLWNKNVNKNLDLNDFMLQQGFLEGWRCTQGNQSNQLPQLQNQAINLNNINRAEQRRLLEQFIKKKNTNRSNKTPFHTKSSTESTDNSNMLYWIGIPVVVVLGVILLFSKGKNKKSGKGTNLDKNQSFSPIYNAV